MDLKKCLGNLKHDLNNGGIDDDSFAMVCYMTMAKKAHKLLGDTEPDKLEQDNAKEYLTMCRNSGYAGLKLVADMTS